MPGTYSGALVCLSILIAITASFTALDLAIRVRASGGWARYAWLTTAALAMGGGIWAMHFVGMLAFHVPGMEVQYDLSLTLVSLLVPVVVTGISFFAVSRADASASTLMLGGIFMGLGIALMHYMGMAAMNMAADLSYDPAWVVASFIIAIAAATVALWLSGRAAQRLAARLAAAAVMGIAISGMHYAGMQGAIFTVHATGGMVHNEPGLDLPSLALAVAAATFLILFLASIAAMYDRRLALMTDREASALRQSEERFRSLYSRTPLPLHSLDVKGRVEYVSQSWLDLLGYRREEVVGRSLVEFMDECSAEKARGADWRNFLRTCKVKETEYRFLTRDGKPVDVIASARVERDTQRGVIQVLGGLIDVTERRRAEMALRQSQKMEAIGKLTGGVAHDFNNLLAVTLGNLELLRQRLPDDPRTAMLVDNAIQAGERGVTLTQRLLTFARRQELRPEIVDLAALVKDVGPLLQRSVGPAVQIEIDFPADLPQAFVDANQLELVLLNLMVNARDAMPDGGSVLLKGCEQADAGLSDSVTTGYVCLSIEDAGEGMDAETLQQCTEPFFTTKGVGKGTGLGLSMAQGLAEQSGGRLVLTSEKGQGTTVQIWLPLAATVPLHRQALSEAIFR
ncbi:MAG TPA: PAS domain S-box protein [Pseudomonas xinjiangensis]|uniref:histidine kinase n=2 Tax=root TaxID=1 RepID=A0A7V1FU78_9GAMM|nr:PAS domain S-box protein [Halopseudomonas xinjiangensis]HEC46999.1 PAS domain S-box protein [Halopseudomonas xinjiangensis]